MDKIDFVDQIEKSELRTKKILIYSVFLTFTFDELCTLLPIYYTNYRIRDRILTQLEKTFQIMTIRS